ncbi:MAG: hypothetical protein HRT68_16740 [Flavobacteriaceae bacterium]|nr:hypothetical protein [Flavobacteriaceae bacterium]
MKVKKVIEMSEKELSDFAQNIADNLNTKNIAIALQINEALNGCFTVNECAEFLKIKPQTVRDRIQNNVISVALKGVTPYSIPKIQFMDQILQNMNLINK